MTLFRVVDLKQYVYCPRIVYYHHCLPQVRPVTFKMEAGLAAQDEEEVRAAILTNKGFPLLRLARAIREEDELEYLRERLEQLDPPKKRSWF